MTTLDSREWRYLRHGRVAHALTSAGHKAAECGVSPWWPDDWYGTGAQVEYETAAALPKCAQCLKKIGALA